MIGKTMVEQKNKLQCLEQEQVKNGITLVMR